jgi:uncharacterized protein YnzC (UPF0291/DUF896 family)
MNERHAEITKLEFHVYPALRAQYGTLEHYRHMRVAELEKADAATGLTEAELQARIGYRGEWNNSPTLREEFGENIEVYLAYRTAVDRGQIKDEEFAKTR